MSAQPISGQTARPQSSRFFGQYIINNHFQFKFGLILFAILAASTFILWLEGHVAINRLIESEMVKNDLLLEQLHLISGIMGKSAIMISTATFAIALFLSHFIAGPMYRFEKTFEEIRNGNLTVIVRLRKHDQFQEVADAFNHALSGLRNKIKKERETADSSLSKVKRLSETLKQAGRLAEAEQLDQLIVELKTPSQVKIL